MTVRPTILSVFVFFGIPATATLVLGNEWELRLAVLVGVCSLLATFPTLSFAPNPRDAFRGKVVLITGSSSGIGEQLAYQYASFGCKIFLSAIGEDLLKAVAEKCEAFSGCECRYLETDLTKPDDCEKTVAECVKAFGTIDVLHLNHGRLEDRMFLDYSTYKDLDRFWAITDCNYYSFVRIAHFALPHMLKNPNPTYIAPTCTGGVAGALPFDGCYTGSKNGMRAFFKTLRLELKLVHPRPGTSVTLMYPGAINTPFTQPHEKMVKGASSPRDLAKAFVHAVAARQREVYFPANIQIAQWLGMLAPALLEWIIVSMEYIPKRPDYVERLKVMKEKLASV